MTTDLSFQSNFVLEIIENYGYGERYYYPSASLHGGRDGLMVEVTLPNASTWVGIFAFGTIEARGISGIYTMPDPDKFCVVSRGAGYVVSSIDPCNWQEVKAIPVTDVRPAKFQNILIFADYTTLTAYDENGIAWKTGRISYDRLKITEITDHYLKGEFWDIRNDSDSQFEIDLATGLQKGGNRDI